MQHDWIWQNRDKDPHQLALSGKFPAGTTPAALVSQVSALQKIKNKIPSWYQSGLYFPLALSLEQASSEATARFKASLFSGESLTDLTGGLGIDSFFMSKAFDRAVYVEQNAVLAEAAQHNFEALKASNIAVVNADALDFLQQTSSFFDLVFIDPARRDDRKGKVFLLEDCTPNILQIKDLIFEKSNNILLKAAPMLDLKLAIQQLGCVAQVWIVESEGDCREVLFWLKKSAAIPLEQVPISAVSLQKSDQEAKVFHFNFEAEAQSQITYSEPRQYLYEPTPAVLKAGAFKHFASQHGLTKLHPHTHLYTSEVLVEGLLARSFAIEHVCTYDRKAIQTIIPEGKANVTTRNFPDSAEQVQKKLHLSNGGSTYLFAATIEGNKKVLMVCKRLIMS